MSSGIHINNKKSQGASLTATLNPSTSKRSIQSRLKLGRNDIFTCKECGMTYSKAAASDIRTHTRYHQKFMSGRDWKSEWGVKLQAFSDKEFIIKVNPRILPEAKAASELLSFANTVLNAPDDNRFWIDPELEGHVYVYVKNSKAVGIISVERITTAKWFSINIGSVVSMIDVPALAGISRIFVCIQYRRKGIAIRLLEAIRTHFIYGIHIEKHMIAWSQPSSQGSKLALSYNSVTHKSGQNLVKIYI